MGIIIEQTECTGCGSCARICPGNLIRLDENRHALLRRPSDCWSCLACMKACRRQAISYTLSPQMGGRGARLSVNYIPGQTGWVIRKGQWQRVLITDTKEANRY